jgi:5-methylcytosine-specific restriction endonuclease McrA
MKIIKKRSKLYKKIYHLKIKTDIKLREIFGYIDKEGAPLKCQYCGSKDLNTRTFYGDGNGILEGMIVDCKNCNKNVGNWDYGHWGI